MLDSDNILPSHLIKDLFITALEVGINYWALIEEYSHETYTAKIIDKEGSQPIQYNLSLNIIHKGVQKLYLDNSNWSKKRINNLLNEDYDAEDADIVLQYGLFGELIYG